MLIFRGVVFCWRFFIADDPNLKRKEEKEEKKQRKWALGNYGESLDKSKAAPKASKS